MLGLLFGARWWLDRQWYVGPSDGSVAIFQGIPLTILGYDLGHPVEVHEDLPRSEVRELEDTSPPSMRASRSIDRQDGTELIDQMEEDLREAAAERAAQDDAGGGP